MSGELDRIIERAAKDPAFLSLLLDDREAAVASLDVGESVKDVLRAADGQQLKTMAWEVRDRLGKGKKSAIVRRSFLYGGLAAAVATIGYVAIPNTLGLPRETIHELNAQRLLNVIALAQAAFMRECGAYGTMEELVAAGSIPQYLFDVPYEISLELGDKTFTATARHKTRPETRKAFVVGPDCEVRELEERK